MEIEPLVPNGTEPDDTNTDTDAREALFLAARRAVDSSERRAARKAARKTPKHPIAYLIKVDIVWQLLSLLAIMLLTVLIYLAASGDTTREPFATLLRLSAAAVGLVSQNNPLIRKGECNFMFAKNSKAYSVYLLFRFVFSLAVSMSTVLSIVYHLEVVQLDAFQLVLVGTVLETSCFLFEIPTGVVADLYSRRRSVLIGMFLYGLGFLMEGALPWFAPVLLAQVVWGCGDTFITGALEAWIASEEEDKPIDKVFLRGSQMGQIGGVLGVVLGTLLGNINLQMPVILGGSLCLLLGLVLVRIMPETNFSPAIEERQGLLKDFVCLFKLNLGFVKGAPVLLALLAITLCGGLASEGFDRLSTAHFLDDTVIPVIGPLNSVTWFGVISLIGSGLGILASQLLIARMEKKGTVSRTSVVMSTSAGYILCLVLFAVGRSFWFMLLVFLLAGLMRTIKEPVLAAWMNDHVDEKMRATVFSTSGQLDSFGQIIGGPIVGLVAQQVSIPWGLVCTAFLLLPALFLVPVAGKKRD